MASFWKILSLSWILIIDTEAMPRYNLGMGAKLQAQATERRRSRNEDRIRKKSSNNIDVGPVLPSDYVIDVNANHLTIPAHPDISRVRQIERNKTQRLVKEESIPSIAINASTIDKKNQTAQSILPHNAWRSEMEEIEASSYQKTQHALKSIYVAASPQKEVSHSVESSRSILIPQKQIKADRDDRLLDDKVVNQKKQKKNKSVAQHRTCYACLIRNKDVVICVTSVVGVLAMAVAFSFLYKEYK